MGWIEVSDGLGFDGPPKGGHPEVQASEARSGPIRPDPLLEDHSSLNYARLVTRVVLPDLLLETAK